MTTLFSTLSQMAYLFLLIVIGYLLALCTVCSLAMPLGLNTIVVPNAYGKDTTVAAGMTIPLVFWLFNLIIPT